MAGKISKNKKVSGLKASKTYETNNIDYSDEIAYLKDAIAKGEADIATIQAAITLKTAQMEELDNARDKLFDISDNICNIGDDSMNAHYNAFNWMGKEKQEIHSIMIDEYILEWNYYVRDIENINHQIYLRRNELEDEISNLNLQVSTLKLVISGLDSRVKALS